MTDVRLMSSAELDALNERGRLCRQKQTPTPAAKTNQVGTDSDAVPSEGRGQLDFGFLVDS